MIKTVGLIAAAAGCFLLGVYKAQEKRMAVRQKLLVCRLLGELAHTVESPQKSYARALSRAAEHGDYEQLHFAAEAGILLSQTRSLSRAVEAAYDQSELPCVLDSEESDIARSALCSACSLDAPAAAAELSRAQIKLSEAAERQRKDCPAQAKLCVTLYTLAGLAAAVFLI